MKLKYICQYCSKEYTNKYVLNRHLKTHIEYKRKEYLWQCKYCSDTEGCNYAQEQLDAKSADL